MNIREATKKWVDGFYAYPHSLIKELIKIM